MNVITFIPQLINFLLLIPRAIDIVTNVIAKVRELTKDGRKPTSAEVAALALETKEEFDRLPTPEEIENR